MNSKAVAVCTTCRLCGWGRGKAGFSRGSVGVMLPPAVQLHCGGTNCASLRGSVELRQASEVIVSLRVLRQPLLCHFYVLVPVRVQSALAVSPHSVQTACSERLGNAAPSCKISS